MGAYPHEWNILFPSDELPSAWIAAGSCFRVGTIKEVSPQRHEPQHSRAVIVPKAKDLGPALVTRAAEVLRCDQDDTVVSRTFARYCNYGFYIKLLVSPHTAHRCRQTSYVHRATRRQTVPRPTLNLLAGIRSARPMGRRRRRVR